MPEKLLIVDDEPANVDMLSQELEEEGYALMTARDGAEALIKVQERLPDLILLDVMMPNLDGFETLRMLREVSSVPVIMLTAKSRDVDQEKALALGADDYVTKPFSTRELVERVRRILGGA